MKTIKQAYDIVYDGDLVYQMLEFAFERLIEVKKKTKLGPLTDFNSSKLLLKIHRNIFKTF